jgi:molecular chaperone HscB
MFARTAIRIAASRPLAAPARRIKQAQQVKAFHISPTLQQQQQQRKCPNCGQPLPSPLPACTSCWNLFSFPKDISHHELLGLSEGSNPFVVDLATLKKSFRQAQSVCHPDSWASKNPVGTMLLCQGTHVDIATRIR